MLFDFRSWRYVLTSSSRITTATTNITVTNGGPVVQKYSGNAKHLSYVEVVFYMVILPAVLASQNLSCSSWSFLMCCVNWWSRYKVNSCLSSVYSRFISCFFCCRFLIMSVRWSMASILFSFFNHVCIS